MPFFNEEKNVEYEVRNLHSHLAHATIDFELVLVDDGSQDLTRSLCERLARELGRIVVVSVSENQGYGAAILLGVASSRGRYVCYTDGDGQVPVDSVTRLYAVTQQSRSGFGKARRIVRESRVRWFKSKVFNVFAALLFGLSVKDINAKPKIFRKDEFEKLGVKSRNWLIDTEIMVKFRLRGVDPVEIPIMFSRRRLGRSKVGLKTVFEFIRDAVIMKIQLLIDVNRHGL